MKSANATNKDLYYTEDHEWINFQGTVAYVGVCAFKLTGFKQIHQIRFRKNNGFKSKGDVLASIKYKDYEINVHMPVDGKITEANDLLINGDKNSLLHLAECDGWIFKIIPASPYERIGLLLPRQYQMNGKSKYAKS